MENSHRCLHNLNLRVENEVNYQSVNYQISFNRNNRHVCVKCGGDNHTSKFCKEPVTSFGLIVYKRTTPKFTMGRMYPFKQEECAVHGKLESFKQEIPTKPNDIAFLLVERKDTVGFLNLVQGAYPDQDPYKSKKIEKYVYELTCEERIKLRNVSFDELWKIAGSHRRDSSKARNKFVKLDIQNVLNKYPCLFREADYLPPKGRLKYGETVRECAVREFSEETGYSKSDVTVLPDSPFVEQFAGTDGKMYRNVFFIASLSESAKLMHTLYEDPSQSKEVRNVAWFSLNDCNKVIRPHHLARKEILRMAYVKIQGMLHPRSNK